MRWVERRWKHVVFWAVLSSTVVSTAVAASPAVAGPRVPGIDVSKYQGRIDWTAVATTPVRFVILRATLGNDYRDGQYGRNAAGAREQGLTVGAYHFAKPSLARWDPRRGSRSLPGCRGPARGRRRPGARHRGDRGTLSPAAPNVGELMARTRARAHGRAGDDLLGQLLLARLHAEHAVVRTARSSPLGGALVRGRSRRPGRPLGRARVHRLAVLGERQDLRHRRARRPGLDAGHPRAGHGRVARRAPGRGRRHHG